LNGLPHELRLALTLLLNVVTFAAAYRFARRRGGAGALQAVCDAFLIVFVTQYVAVALPGALGALHLWTASAVALLASAALVAAAGFRRHHGEPASTLEAREDDAPGGRPPAWRRLPAWLPLAAGGTFVAAYVGAHVYAQRFAPPLSTDALVYHLPTAVQWIQTGELGLFPTWYWNPAATYSPATTSTFMAWLMLPSGDDVFVRFVQVPPLLWIYCLAARLCRLLGCGRGVAALIGVAAATARPFFSEATFPKDDLFVTAFFGAAVLSLAAENLRDRLGPWRVGLAFGMVLACKYTVLLACPLFLFMVDAPFRARWRLKHWLTALGTGAVLFAPWYVRNVVLTGNPLYPVDVKPFGVTIFQGMFGTERDRQLRTAGGVWRMLAATYHSLPAPLLAILAAGWVAGLAGAARARGDSRWRLSRNPLLRASLLGTVATFGVFIVTSPHHEVRYMFPVFLVLFGAAGFAIERWVKPDRGRVAVAAAVAVVSVATGFDWALAGYVGGLLIAALVLTALGVAAAAAAGMWRARLDATRVAAGGLAALVVGGMLVFVFWQAYVRQYHLNDPAQPADAGIPHAWALQYPDQAPLWTFVRASLPGDARIAVANTYFVYPFYDAEYRRRVVHAPVRRGVDDFLAFPRLGDTVPGDLIVQRMTDVMNADADRATWLENLRRSGAKYLVIARFEHEPDPPEARFVAEEPGRFEKLFDDPVAGAVYRIADLPAPPAG
jgi:hypothetical protein